MLFDNRSCFQENKQTIEIEVDLMFIGPYIIVITEE